MECIVSCENGNILNSQSDILRKRKITTAPIFSYFYHFHGVPLKQQDYHKEGENETCKEFLQRDDFELEKDLFLSSIEEKWLASCINPNKKKKKKKVTDECSEFDIIIGNVEKSSVLINDGCVDNLSNLKCGSANQDSDENHSYVSMSGNKKLRTSFKCDEENYYPLGTSTQGDGNQLCNDTLKEFTEGIMNNNSTVSNGETCLSGANPEHKGDDQMERTQCCDIVSDVQDRNNSQCDDNIEYLKYNWKVDTLSNIPNIQSHCKALEEHYVGSFSKEQFRSCSGNNDGGTNAEREHNSSSGEASRNNEGGGSSSGGNGGNGGSGGIGGSGCNGSGDRGDRGDRDGRDGHRDKGNHLGGGNMDENEDEEHRKKDAGGGGGGEGPMNNAHSTKKNNGDEMTENSNATMTEGKMNSIASNYIGGGSNTYSSKDGMRNFVNGFEKKNNFASNNYRVNSNLVNGKITLSNGDIGGGNEYVEKEKQAMEQRKMLIGSKYENIPLNTNMPGRMIFSNVNNFNGIGNLMLNMENNSCSNNKNEITMSGGKNVNMNNINVMGGHNNMPFSKNKNLIANTHMMYMNGAGGAPLASAPLSGTSMGSKGQRTNKMGEIGRMSSSINLKEANEECRVDGKKKEMGRVECTDLPIKSDENNFVGSVSSMNISSINNMSTVNMSGINLGGINMSGINMGGINVSGINVNSINMNSINMNSVNMGGINMGGIHVGNTNMGNVNMGSVNMGSVNMGSVNMGNVNMGSVNMGNVNMGNVNMGNINVYHANEMNHLPRMNMGKNMHNYNPMNIPMGGVNPYSMNTAPYSNINMVNSMAAPMGGSGSSFFPGGALNHQQIAGGTMPMNEMHGAMSTMGNSSMGHINMSTSASGNAVNNCSGVKNGKGMLAKSCSTYEYEDMKKVNSNNANVRSLTKMSGNESNKNAIKNLRMESISFNESINLKNVDGLDLSLNFVDGKYCSKLNSDEKIYNIVHYIVKNSLVNYMFDFYNSENFLFRGKSDLSDCDQASNSGTGAVEEEEGEKVRENVTAEGATTSEGATTAEGATTVEGATTTEGATTKEGATATEGATTAEGATTTEGAEKGELVKIQPTAGSEAEKEHNVAKGSCDEDNNVVGGSGGDDKNLGNDKDDVVKDDVVKDDVVKDDVVKDDEVKGDGVKDVVKDDLEKDKENKTPNDASENNKSILIEITKSICSIINLQQLIPVNTRLSNPNLIYDPSYESIYSKWKTFLRKEQSSGNVISMCFSRDFLYTILLCNYVSIIEDLKKTAVKKKIKYFFLHLCLESGLSINVALMLFINATKQSNKLQVRRGTACTKRSSLLPSETGLGYLHRDAGGAKEENMGIITFECITNDREPDHLIKLITLKNIFSRQLPKMPREYIVRLVFDRNHYTFCLLKKNTVIGGVCFRPYFEQKFAEIAFLAVTSTEQVKGYGTRLMNHLKEHVKKFGIEYFLTYAGKFSGGRSFPSRLHRIGAVCRFVEQGFSQKISMPKERWFGYIKDYDGGTLMECYIFPNINYLRLSEMLYEQKKTVKKAIHFIKPQVVFKGLNFFSENKGVNLHPSNIPGLLEVGWKKETKEMPKKVHHKEIQLKDQILGVLDFLEKQQSAWPFLKPVSLSEAPDYYDIIKEPTDILTMRRKARHGEYKTKEDFGIELKRMFDNCRLYNAPTTIYFKYANELQALIWPKYECISEGAK
ncbi:histone acetyltransferase Gcn5 [Plasmodium ovale wallikeri]|uniref:Histone acetyltransferase Gcn5 n=1 Tax=Plasmodium ovale wallikeri TaxID=864142 RepID=A0A1A8YM91_PLAOA|nr:histone acetyltransferase Gcn5 [Plasmodium ovale wallikeri]